MTQHHSIIAELAKIQTNANAGFAFAFHIDYTRPTLLLQTYPEAWISEYSEKGMVMSDPTVHWGFENEGWMRWTDLAAQDSAGVLKKAASHGMAFGLTCSVVDDATRSMCSFSRNDREFDDSEAAAMLVTTQSLHDQTSGLKSFSAPDLAELENLGINVSQPGGN